MEDDKLAVGLPYPLSTLQLAVNAMLPCLNHFVSSRLTQSSWS